MTRKLPWIEGPVGLEGKSILRDLKNRGVFINLVIQGDTLKLLIVLIDIDFELSCIHRSNVIIPPVEAYVVGGFYSNVRVNGDLNKDRLTN